MHAMFLVVSFMQDKAAVLSLTMPTLSALPCDVISSSSISGPPPSPGDVMSSSGLAASPSASPGDGSPCRRLSWGRLVQRLAEFGAGVHNNNNHISVNNHNNNNNSTTSASASTSSTMQSSSSNNGSRSDVSDSGTLCSLHCSPVFCIAVLSGAQVRQGTSARY